MYGDVMHVFFPGVMRVKEFSDLCLIAGMAKFIKGQNITRSSLFVPHIPFLLTSCFPQKEMTLTSFLPRNCMRVIIRNSFILLHHLSLHNPPRQAKAIQKILGQDSSRKRREEKAKQQRAEAQEVCGLRI